MKRIRLTQKKGAYTVCGEALLIGDDIVLAMWGGSSPHVGAVAMAVPRPSLRDPTATSSTSSVLTRVGHKEDGIVKKVSEKVSATLNRGVVVSAGLHWDDIPEDEVEVVASLCGILADRLISRILESK
jgi:hypothetical protein